MRWKGRRNGGALEEAERYTTLLGGMDGWMDGWMDGLWMGGAARGGVVGVRLVGGGGRRWGFEGYWDGLMDGGTRLSVA